MINLEEQIKLLVELQGLDTQIFRREKDLFDMPENLKKLDEEFKAKMAGLKALEDNLKSMQVKRRDRENDLATKEGSIKKLQTQLYQLKTNKEFSTMQEEIARIKADNSLIEEDILKIFDQVDIENGKISKEKEFLKGEEVKLNDQKRKVEEETKRIKAEADSLKTQRVALVEKVDKTILARYDRIIKAKDGLAVVPVAGGSCQGCFRILPFQVIHEIRMKKDLVICGSCARILYLEE
ncbi:MAG: C4-type zinc ribbon domain-containing protein [Candidatus Omnitrophota bacterium]|nr:C4-type zinc ribbon domain-containing protein [Candidatus Omnitrophota bacterium]